MIRMIQSTSASHAKVYFSDALMKADYYLNDQELNGDYRGRLAARLGLSGKADKAGFFDLCENRAPKTGKPLTPYTKEERTTGYDINFHCPKSVSIVHMFSKDEHIVEAFRQSVHETMTDIEADSKARVRKGKQNEDRDTGELLYVDFVHQTARPIDGSEPDPHLHAHCYVFNATYDPVEQRIKAGQFRDIKRDMPYYEAMFHKRLSDRLIGLGYQVRRTKKSFEIEGVPQRVIDLFSKRTDEIGKAAKEKGIKDAKGLDELGARTRSKKQKGLTMDELKASWRRQIKELGPLPVESHQAVRYGPAKEERLPTAEKCLDHAISHSYERASVMPERRLLATAYIQSIGAKSTTIKAINEQLKASPSIIRVQDGRQAFCTTKDVLQEEKRMVTLAQAGRGRMAPLYTEAPEVKLKAQQGEAVKHILATPDMVSIVRGAAGTGKTTLMREAVDWIEKAGKKVTVLAPTSTAAREVLRGEGYEKAETVAGFLLNKELQVELKGQVLWVDEAGLLGTKDMKDLLEIATKQNARLILGGDTRQHASVVRGDALRILNQIGKIKTAEVSKIYRQKNEQYREAVLSLSVGNIVEGFEKLDGMGAIKKTGLDKPHEELVKDYVGTIKKGQEGLIISPTNAHRRQVTADIRSELRKSGLIGKKEITAQKLENMHFTHAQKDDYRNYRPGQVVHFLQNAPGVRRGSKWQVKEVSQDKIQLTDKTGKAVTLPQGRAHCFEVMEQSELQLAKGDRVMITHNGMDAHKKRLDNGQMLDVVQVRKDGRIRLRNRLSRKTYDVDKDFGHIDHAHCVTSYASQGKTVDEIFIAQPAATFPASDAKQFYVSVSRAREGIKIYTDDKEELLSHVQKAGDRTSALELTSLKRHSKRVQDMKRKEDIDRQKDAQPEKDMDRKHDWEREYPDGWRLDKNSYEPEIDIDLDYEP